MKRTKKLLSFFLAIVMVITAIPAFTLTASAATTDVTKSNNENSVINRIVLDDAIYTYQSETAYYNYGTVISDLDPWDTKVVFKNGASRSDLSSITCVDSGETLSLNGTEKLTGDLKADKFKVSGATDVNATLKFTFNDGAVEYHRVAVKSYPVETHVCSQAIKNPRVGSWTETGYTLFMRGSTGTNGNGVWRFQKSYYTSGNDRHNTSEKSIANDFLSADKAGGTYGRSEGKDAPPSTIGLATYYIDKSCKDTQWAGLGNSDLWKGKNYVIPIEVVRTKFAYDQGSRNNNLDLNQCPVAQDKLVKTSSDNNIKDDSNGTTHTFTFTHNESFDKTSRWNSSYPDYNIRIALRTTDYGWALLNCNLEVKLFDKSTARTAYYNEIKDSTALKETDYTASSFATYQNALLNLESYLSNYEDTDTSKMTSLVNSLNTAKANLAPRATEAEYQAMVTAYTNYKAVTPNKDNYTTTSYNKFYNDAIFDGDLVTAENGALSIKNQVEADSSAMRDVAKSACTTYTNKFNEYLNKLELKADFRNYNASVDNSTTDLSSYTSQSSQYLPTYNSLKPFGAFTLYTVAQKNDTGVSQQETVNNKRDAIENARTAFNGTAKIDQTTLQAFVSHIATFDKDVYDEGAVNTVKSNIDAIYKTVTFNGVDYYSLDVKDLDDYDSKLRGFINSFNSALDEYTVTVPSNVTAKVNGSPVTPTTTSPSKTYTLPYGTNVTFTTDDNALTAWYMDYTSNVTSRGKQFQKHAESFTTKIIGSITIYAESASDSASCVTIVRQYDQANVSPALDRASYVTTGGTYTLPTEPTRVANYNFTGYYVNGVEVTGSVTINADTQIVAKYEYAGSPIKVTVNGTEKTYAYNANVTINDASAYAWVEQVGTSDTWRPFYIGTTCTFKVSEPTVLKPVTESEFKAMFTDEAYAPILRQNGAMADEAGRAVINAQRIDYLPADAVIQEFGILVSKTAASDFDLVNNVNTIRCKSSQELDKVQFTIFLKGAGSSTFTYRSYMIYKLADGTIKTVYSDVANYPVTNA